MKFHKSGTKYLVRIEKGEEIVATLKKLCKDENIKIGSVSGIGAGENLEINFFDTKTKSYHPKTYEKHHEIIALNGNISQFEGEPALHLHISIANEKHRTFGGHLNMATVSVTCEVIIDTMEGVVERKKDPECGLNLLDM